MLPIKYPRHRFCNGDPSSVLADCKKSGRVVSKEVLHFSIVSSISVRCIDLFNTFSDHAPLLYTGSIVRKVEHRRVVILVSDFNSKGAESCELLVTLILCFHCNTIICDTDLRLTIEHVRRLYDPCDRIDVKSVTALVARLH